MFTSFELGPDFIGTKLLTKFHEDGTRNQMLMDGRTYDGQRPVTKAHLSNQFAHLRGTNILFHDPRQNCPPPSSHVFQMTGTIFELKLSKFHENWAKNVTSTKNAPPTGGHVFSPIPNIFKLVRDINKTNVLTNFHDDWVKKVTSRVFSSKSYCKMLKLAQTDQQTDQQTGQKQYVPHYYSGGHKNAPPTGGHVFSPISTIFELVRDIN
ncbi:hypothetical protein DPMN_090123 [Dreissena polymorpha]|uniref:Uncharacterized protein n=1 Tax=Dreissena polymorpha TaxID=45954 RepID=A0A9D4KX57_DREPO|nr:hypothetical protein DPMN_090123 [Dreissena polymorpha]